MNNTAFFSTGDQLIATGHTMTEMRGSLPERIVHPLYFLLYLPSIAIAEKTMTSHEKPLLLSAALLLSIIGNSIACIAFFTAALFFSRTKELIGTLTNIQTPEKVSSSSFMIMGALYGLSLAGAIRMTALQKSGFYFYLAAQAGLLAVPFIWAGADAFSLANTIFTLLFASIYAGFRKRFR